MGTLVPVRHLTDRDVVETGRWETELVGRDTAVGPYLWAGAWQTVRIESFSRPSWLTDFVDQLKALSARRATRTGVPLNANALQKAFTFLNAVMRTDTAPPFLAELMEGGLQLEWHRGGIDVEVQIPPEGAAMLVYEAVDGSEEWEGPLDLGRELFLSRVVGLLGL